MDAAGLKAVPHRRGLEKIPGPAFNVSILPRGRFHVLQSYSHKPIYLGINFYYYCIRAPLRNITPLTALPPLRGPTYLRNSIRYF